jgi:hypothetical protein
MLYTSAVASQCFGWAACGPEGDGRVARRGGRGAGGEGVVACGVLSGAPPGGADVGF